MFKISMGLIFTNLFFMGMYCAEDSCSYSKLKAGVVKRVVSGSDFVAKTAITYPKITGASTAVVTGTEAGLLLKRAEIADDRAAVAIVVLAGAGLGLTAWAILDKHNRAERWRAVEVKLDTSVGKVAMVAGSIAYQATRVVSLTSELEQANGVVAGNTGQVSMIGEVLGKAETSLGNLSTKVDANQAVIAGKFTTTGTAVDSKITALKADCVGSIAEAADVTTRIEAKFAAVTAQTAQNLRGLKALTASIGSTVSPAAVMPLAPAHSKPAGLNSFESSATALVTGVGRPSAATGRNRDAAGLGGIGKAWSKRKPAGVGFGSAGGFSGLRFVPRDSFELV